MTDPSMWLPMVLGALSLLGAIGSGYYAARVRTGSDEFQRGVEATEGIHDKYAAKVEELREELRRERDDNEALRKEIGELRSTVKEYQARLEVLEKVVRLQNVGEATIDRDLYYLRVNEVGALLNGVSVKAHEGSHVRDVLPDGLADMVEPLLMDVLENMEPRAGVLSATINDEDTFWSYNYRPIITRRSGGVGSHARAVDARFVQLDSDQISVDKVSHA